MEAQWSHTEGWPKDLSRSLLWVYSLHVLFIIYSLNCIKHIPVHKTNFVNIYIPFPVMQKSFIFHNVTLKGFWLTQWKREHREGKPSNNTESYWKSNKGLNGWNCKNMVTSHMYDQGCINARASRGWSPGVYTGKGAHWLQGNYMFWIIIYMGVCSSDNSIL